tara:strand:+ start:2482 stop:3288 length:807 start_codon:yes stop_codon:yes gene_type:complete
MSLAKLFNVPAVTLRPGPVLVIGKSSDGLTTGSLDFTCRKGDLSSPLILNKLAKGTAINELYPQISVRFAYLAVDSWSSRDNPGGYSTVSVEFKGADVSGEGDYTFDSSIVYTRNNSLVDDVIFNSPKFIAAVTDSEQRSLIRQGFDGIVKLTGSSSITDVATGVDVGSLNTTEEEFWWNWIVEKKNGTFTKATSEWTKSATGRGTLPSSSFAKFGKIDDPPGSPGKPAGEEWLYTGATESISVAGGGANSYSQTWISGVWPEEVYGD